MGKRKQGKEKYKGKKHEKKEQTEKVKAQIRAKIEKKWQTLIKIEKWREEPNKNIELINGFLIKKKLGIIWRSQNRYLGTLLYLHNPCIIIIVNDPKKF